MSSAVTLLFRYESEIWSTRRQASDAKQADLDDDDDDDNPEEQEENSQEEFPNS
jgi:hypothetical protein